MKKLKYRLLLLTPLMLLTVGLSYVFAQGPPPPPPPEEIPIDGGISLLAAAGIGYGAKKLYDRKNKTNS